MERILIVFLVFVLIIGCTCGAISLLNEKHLDDMLEYVDLTVEKALAQNDTAISHPNPQLDENGNWFFETDEDFKVIQLTDIHIGGGILSADTDEQAINAVASMIAVENPDLVIVTGDISFAIPTTGTINNKYAHEIFIHLMEKLGVYWTITLGNHDSEPYNYHNREAVANMYASEDLERCLFRQASNVSGRGNHLINVQNSKGEILQSLFMIDSHSYIRQDFFGGLIDSLFWNYDNIKQDQIDWYKDMLELYNPKSSMMFFHIPLAEVKEGYDEYIANGRELNDDVRWFVGNDGEKDDVVYPSRLGDDLFENILDLGNTSYMFFGHDHFNNFVMNYKGVSFCYGYSVDYMAYGNIGSKGYQRGCTVINIDSVSEDVTVTHENYYQEKYGSLDEKENMNMDKDAYKGE